MCRSERYAESDGGVLERDLSNRYQIERITVIGVEL
jgi:hypothetical protein